MSSAQNSSNPCWAGGENPHHPEPDGVDQPVEQMLAELLAPYPTAVVQSTRGYESESSSSPSATFGKSLPPFTLTATLTTGGTLYFVPAVLYASPMS